jgi:23S rRNA pseudouridine2457 synthase
VKAGPNNSFAPAANCKYIALNKPFQLLCQFSQPEDSNKATLATLNLPAHVYPVGRLDYDSEGLLILTDDARLNSNLLDPIHNHCRTYWAQVENIPSAQALETLRQGVIIEAVKTRPAQTRILSAEPHLPERHPPIRTRKNIPTSWLELTLTEGRNRQVRKMTAAIGCPTLRLVRAAIGNLQLEILALQSGEWMLLKAEQIQLLFQKPHIAQR